MIFLISVQMGIIWLKFTAVNNPWIPLNSKEFWDSSGFPAGVCTPTVHENDVWHHVRQNDWTSCYQFHKFRKESPRGTRAAMNFIADYEDHFYI